MSTTPHLPPPAAPPQRRGPGLGVAMSLLVVVLGWNLITNLAPAVTRQALLIWPIGFALGVTNYLLYAAVVAILARSTSRRILALLLILAAAIAYTATAVVLRNGPDNPNLVEVVFRVNAYLYPILIVAAWGISRRESWWWPLGLAVIVGLVAFRETEIFRDGLGWAVRTFVGDSPGLAPWESLPYALFNVLLVSWPPLILGGLACWLIDVAARGMSKNAGPASTYR